MRAFLRRIWQTRRALLFYACLLIGGWGLSELASDIVLPEMRPMNEPMIHRFVMGAFIAFIVTAAIPFVPGAEIGFALLLLFGGKAAPLVYVGMVLALVLAYCIAAIAPLGPLSAVLAWLRLRKAAAFVSRLDGTPRAERGRLLTGSMPSLLGERLLRRKYLALAAALNTPGNSLVGGGGGLAFMAGASGLFGFWPYLATVMIAVAPAPLAFFLA